MFAINYTPAPQDTVTHVTEAIFMSERTNIVMIYIFIYALLLKSHVLEATANVLPALTQVSYVTANFTQTQSLTLVHTRKHTQAQSLTLAYTEIPKSNLGL